MRGSPRRRRRPPPRSAETLAADHAHFRSVRRPDASPFLRKEGLLFLDEKQLEQLLNGTIDAQPFLGQLVADPSARGLFAALVAARHGRRAGASRPRPVPAGAARASIRRWRTPSPATRTRFPGPAARRRRWPSSPANTSSSWCSRSWITARSQPGGAATRGDRARPPELEFVKSGDARVRITGNVALADEEFATVAEGAVGGLIVSIVLITLWLFLAVRSWRLIVPILLTLGLGLMLTLLFAAAAVGTLNLVSVGFGILFVGIAVDFAIQFSVRYRGMRRPLSPIRTAR